MVNIREMSSEDFYGVLSAIIEHRELGSWKGKEPKITYATVMQVICINSMNVKR